MKRLRWLGSRVVVMAGLCIGIYKCMSPAAIAQNTTTQNDPAIVKILQTLKSYGFQVSFSRPPVSQAYGLIQPSTKKIWIHPLTHQLGIAKQTLIHEATHAAQSCQSPGKQVEPIGIKHPISPTASRHFLRYHGFRRHVEAEALTVQGLPQGAEYVVELLHQHCGDRARSES